jgi:hypothetical protein
VSVSQATKLRWFDRGAAAFERTFPGLIASRFGPHIGPVYVCPICDRGFRRPAVEAGVLTAEHVPPDSLGGRELLLTCKDCNNTAGTELDAHARRKENVLDVMKGEPIRPLKVRVEHRGHRVNARLMVSDSGWAFQVVKHANSPAALRAFQEAGPPTAGTPINVEFDGDRFSELSAKMSWFRSGFLALFAAFGYRFSFDPALEIVKRQLRSPDKRMIYSFLIEIPPRFGWSQWRILEIPEPRSTGVMFGSYVLIYPHRGDVGFYDRLESTIRSQGSRPPVQVTAQSFELIDGEACFGYDVEALSSVTGGRTDS